MFIKFAFKLSIVFKLRDNLVNIQWKMYGCVHNNCIFWHVLTEVVPFGKSAHIYIEDHTSVSYYFDFCQSNRISVTSNPRTLG